MASILNQPTWEDVSGLAESLILPEPTKQIIMVREVKTSEAPKQITTPSGDELLASEGDFVGYMPGEHLRSTLDEYDHWILDPNDFAQNYHHWVSPERPMSLTEQHLLDLGCKPYYKAPISALLKPDEPIDLLNVNEEESFWTWLVNLVKGKR